MMSNVPPKQPGKFAQCINAMLQERHHLLLTNETSSTHTDDTIFRNDTESLTFPWKLHALLEAAAKEGFEHIVSWLDNNASFKVHEPALFIKYIMPRFFKRQSKYKSFQRQLNIWQFERLIGPKGSCNGGYFHVFFYRHDTSLFHLMKRSPLSQKPSSLQETSSYSSLDHENDHFQNFENQTIQYQSNSLSTREPRKPESRDVYPSTCAFFSGPSVNTDSTTSCRACSSVPNHDALKVSIYSDCLNLDTSKPQYPNVAAREFKSLTSTPGSIPNSWEQAEAKYELPNNSFPSYWGDREVLPSPETILGLYATSHLDDDVDRDKGLSRCKSEEGNIEGEGSSLVLSAEEWKYVLVGMRMAMNAE